MSYKRNSDISTLTDNMQVKTSLMQSKVAEAGLNAHPFETRRTRERQLHLAGKHRTIQQCIAMGMTAQEAKTYADPHDPRNRTWTLNSRHFKGEACDWAFKDDNDNWTWEAKYCNWPKLIEIGKSCGLDNLSPTESAHFQDNNKPFNQLIMPTTDYIGMSEKLEQPILTSLSGENPISEGQVKALINIASDRIIKRIVELLNK